MLQMPATNTSKVQKNIFHGPTKRANDWTLLRPIDRCLNGDDGAIFMLLISMLIVDIYYCSIYLWHIVDIIFNSL